MDRGPSSESVHGYVFLGNTHSDLQVHQLAKGSSYRSMLNQDHRRMTIHRLLVLIHKEESDHNQILYDECCRNFFDRDKAYVKEGLLRTDDEGVDFCENIQEATLTPAEDQRSLRPSLVAVISPRVPTLERRLVLCEDPWPFPKQDKLREVCKYRQN